MITTAQITEKIIGLLTDSGSFAGVKLFAGYPQGSQLNGTDKAIALLVHSTRINSLFLGDCMGIKEIAGQPQLHFGRMQEMTCKFYLYASLSAGSHSCGELFDALLPVLLQSGEYSSVQSGSVTYDKALNGYRMEAEATLIQPAVYQTQAAVST